ncbi:hypothetical protein BX070DRAFT_262534 [Coemansia spiralis]|nr:hypothetical protein BX070DRAFT_262534 [Coemansia spiralis]
MSPTNQIPRCSRSLPFLLCVTTHSHPASTMKFCAISIAFVAALASSTAHATPVGGAKAAAPSDANPAHAAVPDFDSRLEARAWDYYRHRRDSTHSRELNARAWDYYNYRRDNTHPQDLNARAWDYYNYRRDNNHPQKLNIRAWGY